MELPCSDIGQRFDSRISEINIDDVPSKKEIVEKKLKELNKGLLIIKEFPAGVATINSLKKHYETVVLKGKKPHLILIDYPALMKSVESYESRRFEESSIFRGLKGWSREINLPIWGVDQINRAGFDVEILTPKNTSECYEKSQIVDLWISINRDKTGPSPEIGNMFIGKSRMGPDGLKFLMCIDTSISKLDIMINNVEVNESDTEEQYFKKLRQKFKDFQKSAPKNPNGEPIN